MDEFAESWWEEDRAVGEVAIVDDDEDTLDDIWCDMDELAEKR